MTHSVESTHPCREHNSPRTDWLTGLGTDNTVNRAEWQTAPQNNRKPTEQWCATTTTHTKTRMNTCTHILSHRTSMNTHFNMRNFIWAHSYFRASIKPRMKWKWDSYLCFPHIEECKSPDTLLHFLYEIWVVVQYNGMKSWISCLCLFSHSVCLLKHMKRKCMFLWRQ